MIHNSVLRSLPSPLTVCFALSVLTVSACADPAPRTQVMIVIDADQAVRAESVYLRVVVRGGRGESMGGLDDRFFRDFDVSASDGWPVELGVIPLDGDVGRLFEIEAAGIDAARREVTLVRARSGFAAERTLVLRLLLEDECRGVVCTARQTCTGGTCADVVVTPVDDLPPYDPNIRPDSGMPMPVVCDADPECDDLVFCNGREHCLDHACVPGLRVVCDDGVSCTRDVCRGNSCVSEPDHTVCDAGPGGRCAGSAGCQYEICDARTCASDPTACETARCEDAMTCSRVTSCGAGETCCGGACAPAGCTDGNDCTLDACDPTAGCTHTARLGATCNDGDTCTAGDVCGGDGRCAGSPRSCDDMNPCSDDSCSPGAGCVNTPNAIACNDGNACTRGDVCASGACNPGIACDDGIACTTDLCDGTGCVFTPNSALCTASSGGVCNPTIGCQYATCDATTCVRRDLCENAVCAGATCMRSAVTCGTDGNSCTDELCNPSAGCQSVPNSAACNDGNPCTIGDRCASSACGGTPNPCDDGNPCTGTSCTPGVGCAFTVVVGTPCGPADMCEQNLCDPGGSCRLYTTVCSVSGADGCRIAYCDGALGCREMNNDGASCCSGAGFGSCMGGSCVTGPPPTPVCDIMGGG